MRLPFASSCTSRAREVAPCPCASLAIPVGAAPRYDARILFDLSFGELVPAILKLAAVFTFPSAVGMLIPVPMVGWLVSLALYLGLLMWFFEFELRDAIICALAIWAVQFVTVFVIAGVVMALFAAA